MIAKAPKTGKYGKKTTGVLYYLFGPGKENEHTNPHLVAAWDPEWLPGGEFANLLDERGGLAALAREIDASMTGYGEEVPGGHVYHVSLSVHRHDEQLGDATWRELAEDAIRHMGFDPDSSGGGGCRWVAVHHGLSTAGNDHLHLLVNLMRGTGRIADTSMDFPRWRGWCRKVEDRWGLTPTSPAGAGRRATSRPELDRARRRGKETERARLRRLVYTAAVTAYSEPEFLRLLAERAVLYQPHLSGGKVVGYKVALAGDDKPLWLSGSTLQRDLSLPKLRSRWVDGPEDTQRAFQIWTGQVHIERDVDKTISAEASARWWARLQFQLRDAQAGLADVLANSAPNTARWHEAVGYTADLVALLKWHSEQPDPQLQRVHDNLARAAQFPRHYRPTVTKDALALLYECSRMAVFSGDPTPLVVAVVVFLVFGIVAALVRIADGLQVNAAARRYVHQAANGLARHPAIREGEAAAQQLTPAQIAGVPQILKRAEPAQQQRGMKPPVMPRKTWQRPGPFTPIRHAPQRRR